MKPTALELIFAALVAIVHTALNPSLGGAVQAVGVASLLLLSLLATRWLKRFPFFQNRAGSFISLMLPVATAFILAGAVMLLLVLTVSNARAAEVAEVAETPSPAITQEVWGRLSSELAARDHTTNEDRMAWLHAMATCVREHYTPDTVISATEFGSLGQCADAQMQAGNPSHDTTKE